MSIQKARWHKPRCVSETLWYVSCVKYLCQTRRRAPCTCSDWNSPYDSGGDCSSGAKRGFEIYHLPSHYPRLVCLKERCNLDVCISVVFVQRGSWFACWFACYASLCHSFFSVMHRGLEFWISKFDSCAAAVLAFGLDCITEREVELLKKDASQSIYHALNVAPSGRPAVCSYIWCYYEYCARYIAVLQAFVKSPGRIPTG